MKTPPIPAERLAPTTVDDRSERDRSFLFFTGVVLVAIALGFKSELLGQGQVWALSLGMVVVAAPALLGYLRGMEEFPRIEHYIPVALGAITLAGLSLLVPELWKYLVLTAIFGVGFVVAARLDYLRLRDEEKRGHLVLQETILILALAGAYLVVISLHFNAILQLFWIFTITFLAWAVTALAIYLVVNEGTFAVMLLFAWYINRGLVRHTVEDSFTRNVVLEYGAFAIVLVYLFVSSYQPGR